MSKKNIANASVEANTVNEPVKVVTEVVEVAEVPALTYEAAVLLIPAGEHRKFTEGEFASAMQLATPTDAETLDAIKGLSRGGIYALCVKMGPADCAKVATLVLTDTTGLLPSHVGALKKVAKGANATDPTKDMKFAGELAYSLIGKFKIS